MDCRVTLVAHAKVCVAVRERTYLNTSHYILTWR